MRDIQFRDVAIKTILHDSGLSCTLKSLISPLLGAAFRFARIAEPTYSNTKTHKNPAAYYGQMLKYANLTLTI